MVKDTLGRMVEKPRYGGVVTLSQVVDPMSIDDAYVNPAANPMQRLTNECLITGDWTRGPTGTGEASWSIPGANFVHLTVGAIAETWEWVDDETIVYHIRKGIHFHDKPPVNGRELTADDVAFSVGYMKEGPGYWSKSYGPPVASWSAPDKWTAVVKSLPGRVQEGFLSTSDFMAIIPHEVIEKYGSVREWENVVGTGPFILQDCTPASFWHFERNPNYWMKDPFHPDNQLPYIDTVHILTIPDLSTRMAALRTGKVDELGGIVWEDHASLKRTNPELKSKGRVFVRSYNIWFRLDKPELPYDDIRVRRALYLATNQQEIKDLFYGGEAVMLSYPINPYEEYLPAYTPLEEMPESIRELYEYHPDKAKELLAEAGYPDGFKAKIDCLAYPHVDILSIIKDQWAKVGVELELQVKESAVHRSIRVGRKHEDMIMADATNGANYKLLSFRPEVFFNYSYVNDERINEAWEVIGARIMDWERNLPLLKELAPYIIGQCWSIETPAPIYYTIWQPWLKAYSGETHVNHANYPTFLQYLWHDQDLKEEMTGRR